MGNTINDHRAAIGTFNAVKCKKSKELCFDWGAYNVPPNTKPHNKNLWFRLLTISFLLSLSMDVHPNPGPTRQHTNNASLCNLNIRSVNVEDRMTLIRTELGGTYDIITATETYLKPKHQSSNYKINGYSGPFRLDRQPQRSGGIMAWTKTSMITARRRDLEANLVEIMWLEVKAGKTKFLLAVCYRQPNGDYTPHFWEGLETSLELAKRQGIKEIILTGDFNADIGANETEGKILDRFLAKHNLFQHVDKPTRTDPVSGRKSILDLIITNHRATVLSTAVSDRLHLNDHNTISALLQFKLPKQKAYTRRMWDYAKADFNSLRASLAIANWDACFQTDSIDQAVENWNAILMDAAYTHIPNKMVTVRPNDHPWFKGNLRRLKRDKNRKHREYLRSGSQEALDDYRKARNTYFIDIRKAQFEYEGTRYQSLATEAGSCPKKWWRLAKEMLGMSQTSQIPAILVDDTVVTDDKEKAEAFNKTYLESATLDDDGKEPPPVPEVGHNLLSELQITHDDVNKALLSLKPDKAFGPDGISPRILKEARPVIVASLCRLFNMSLFLEVFPALWKKANVCPIYKKAEDYITTNYRPVSLLSILAKVFERVVFKHLFKYFKDNFLINMWQSGFLPGCSTVTQLVEMYNVFCQAVSDGKEIRITFLDISKAFDRVWHKGLMFKLARAGISGKLLSWLEDYLHDRVQRVVINGQYSKWGSIKSGVPQGSVLGPLLFLVYINDIVHVVKHCKIRLFADDTCLFIKIDNPEDAARLMNEDLESINQWSNDWLVKFSAPKTKEMLITKKRDNVAHPPIVLNGTMVDTVKSHKHLGIILKDDLKWDKHVVEMTNKAKKRLAVMNALKFKLDRRSLETMYMAFVRPILEYGDVIWDTPSTGDHTLDELEVIQNNAARVVSGATAKCTTVSLHTELKWKTLAARRKDHRLSLFYKTQNNLAPEYMTSQVPGRVLERTHYALRNREQLDIPRSRVQAHTNSFYPVTTRDWNALDQATQAAPTYNAFRRHIAKGGEKANPLYYYGKRKLAVNHTRLRMGCSALRKHLHRLNLVDTPTCACTLEEEDTYHFFFVCPLYQAQRAIMLQSIHQITYPSLNLVLYGDPILPHQANQIIFGAVQSYIEQTRRF